MRAYVDPVPATLSRSMHRVARALRAFAPADVSIVEDVREADFQVVHSVGPNQKAQAPSYAMIQYCLASAVPNDPLWSALWGRSQVVWSYYQMRELLPECVRFYHAPLGVDAVFHERPAQERTIGIVTSGYVSGPGAEAIEEVAEAALRCNLPVFHLGPESVEGMRARKEKTWRASLGISDDELAEVYSQARWVSGLRRIEGFELPVLEGLMCGARPIVFNRPEMRKWYDGHAVFIPEESGPGLVKALVEVLSMTPAPVSGFERAVLAARFDWRTIVEGFWKEVLS